MGKKEYLENTESMNAFYSLVLEIERRFEEKFPRMVLEYQFEVSFTVGDHRIKPDVVMRRQVVGKTWHNILAMEYKDSGRAENVLKPEQIVKYNAIDEKVMRESGLQILRNADFEGVSVVYRNRKRNLTCSIRVGYEAISKIINFPLGVFALTGKDLLKIQRVAGSSFELLELVCRKAFLLKELCLFDFKTDIRRRVREVKQLPANIRSNVSVLLAMLLGYSIRFSWKNPNFTVADVIKDSSPITWKIMEKMKNVQRILRVFDGVVERLLVKNKYLESAGKAEILGAKINIYRFCQDRNLLHKKTRDSLLRLVRRYLDEEIFGEKLINELPLFKWSYPGGATKDEDNENV